MVLYVDLHSMPGFLCRHGLSQAFCENLWSLVCNYRNIWESVCSMSCYGIYDRSMVNYILWLEKQVFLMYLNQRCSLIVPCTSLFPFCNQIAKLLWAERTATSLLQWGSWSIAQPHYQTSPSPSPNFEFSQSLHCSLPCLVMCAAWLEAMGQAQLSQIRPSPAWYVWKLWATSSGCSFSLIYWEDQGGIVDRIWAIFQSVNTIFEITTIFKHMLEKETDRENNVNLVLMMFCTAQIWAHLVITKLICEIQSKF